MSLAVAALRARGFFEGKVYAARIVARSFVLDNKPRPFEALCTPVLIDSQICRLTQYFFLSEAEFAERRSKEGLVTFLGSNL